MLNLLACLAAVIASLVAILAWLDTRGDRKQSAMRDMIEAALLNGLQPVREEVAILKMQMSVYWKGIGSDAASIIHQPDPRRHHIDQLIDRLRERTITEDEVGELRGHLTTILHWEPGKDAEFPILQGEQSSASQLLRTMEHMMTEPQGGGSA